MRCRGLILLLVFWWRCRSWHGRGVMSRWGCRGASGAWALCEGPREWSAWGLRSAYACIHFYSLTAMSGGQWCGHRVSNWGRRTYGPLFFRSWWCYCRLSYIFDCHHKCPIKLTTARRPGLLTYIWETSLPEVEYSRPTKARINQQLTSRTQAKQNAAIDYGLNRLSWKMLRSWEFHFCQTDWIESSKTVLEKSAIRDSNATAESRNFGRQSGRLIRGTVYLAALQRSGWMNTGSITLHMFFLRLLYGQCGPVSQLSRSEKCCTGPFNWNEVYCAGENVKRRTGPFQWKSLTIQPATATRNFLTSFQVHGLKTTTKGNKRLQRQIQVRLNVHRSALNDALIQ